MGVRVATGFALHIGLVLAMVQQDTYHVLGHSDAQVGVKRQAVVTTRNSRNSSRVSQPNHTLAEEFYVASQTRSPDSWLIMTRHGPAESRGLGTLPSVPIVVRPLVYARPKPVQVRTDSDLSPPAFRAFIIVTFVGISVLYVVAMRYCQAGKAERFSGPKLRLASLCATCALSSLSAGYVIPFLPFIAADFGANKMMTSVLLGATFMTGSVSSLYLGYISDKVGRQPILLITCWGQAFSSLLLVCSQSYAECLIVRLLSGAFGGVISTAELMAADDAAPSERAGALAMTMAGAGVGVVGGPALCGLVAPFGTTNALLFIFALNFMNWLFTYFNFRTPSGCDSSGSVTVAEKAGKDADHSGGQSESQTNAMFFFNSDHKKRMFFFYLYTSNLIGIARYAVANTLPLFAIDLYGFSERQMGAAYTVGAIVAIAAHVFLTSRAVARFGEVGTVMFGCIYLAVTTPMFLYQAHYMPFVLASLNFASEAFLGPPVAAAVSGLCDTQSRGVVFGLYQALRSLQLALGCVIGGALYVTDQKLPFLFTGSASVAVFILCALQLSKTDQRNDQVRRVSVHRV